RSMSVKIAGDMVAELSMDSANNALPGASRPTLGGLEKNSLATDGEQSKGAGGGQGETPQPTIRKNFADTAFWTGSLTTDKDGVAEVSLTMPETLTAWKIKVWAMGHGTKVGESTVEVVTKKDLIVRMQAPRFFVERDEVTLSANVHNYLKTAK